MSSLNVGDPPADADSASTLCWRLPPEESYADWKIEIVRERDGGTGTNVDCYDVHRCILSMGPRKCQYFDPVFRSDAGYQESQAKTSRIELPGLAADAVRHLLDYSYGKDPDIDTENVAATLYLADRFGNRRLAWEARKFWKEDMDAKNCHVYYRHAAGLLRNSDVFLKDVVAACSKFLFEFTHSSEILKAVDANFWLEAIQMRCNSGFDELSENEELNMGEGHWYEHLGVLITEICEINSDMDRGVFQQLTDEALLPSRALNTDLALRLLQVETEIVGDGGGGGNSDGLSSLQERAIDVLVGKRDEALMVDLISKYPHFLSQKLFSTVFNKISSREDELSEAKRDCKRLKQTQLSITVKGAGRAGVNGKYEQIGFKDGAFVFAKGLEQGGNGIFQCEYVIRQVVGERNSKRWCIREGKDDRVNADPARLRSLQGKAVADYIGRRGCNLYAAPVRYRYYQLPPNAEWEVAGNAGSAPVPEVEYSG